MAKITHPEMRRGQPVTQTSTQQSNNYVVDDLSDVDQRLAEFEEQKSETSAFAEEIKVIDTEAKKKLEQLIFIGRHSITVTLAEHKFEISTLTHKENNEIITRLMNMGDVSDMFIIRTLTLAHALKSIDNVKLNTIDIDGEFKNDLDKRADIIDGMQLALVEKLYASYENLVKDADKVVYGESIKQLIPQTT